MTTQVERTKLEQRLIDAIVILMDSLTPEERLEVMYQFCTECGAKQPDEKEEYAMRCQCWNDE